MIRDSLKLVLWKDYKNVTQGLKRIYQADTSNEARTAIDVFAHSWGRRYPQISHYWHDRWDKLVAIFEYPPEIRKIIYTINAVESLNSVMRKATRKRKLFPSDDSALMVVYLAVTAESKKWTMPIQNWKAVLYQFSIKFGDRVNHHL